MRNKRYIVSFLLFISMIMLVVPVIPHHHHADGVICMKNDLTPEPQCPKHHHPGNDSCCNDGCMTRLNSPTPSVQADNNPHYLFTAILFTDFIIENLFRPRSDVLRIITHTGSLSTVRLSTVHLAFVPLHTLLYRLLSHIS